MKHVRRWGIVVAFVLIGCQLETNDQSRSVLEQLLSFVVREFNEHGGLVVLFGTLLLHLLLLPLMLTYYHEQALMNNKLEQLAPSFEQMHARMRKAQCKEEQIVAQQHMLATYKGQQVRLFHKGCIALIIQIAVSMGLYMLVVYTDATQQSFLWFSLAEPDYYVALFAGVCCFLQLKVSNWTMLTTQPLQRMHYIVPLMVAMMALLLAAVLPLYWGVSSLLTTIECVVWYRYFSHVA